MELKPRCFEKVVQLVKKGVNIPNPLSLDIGEEVKIDQISGNNVIIYPGCRIYGEKTVISSGARIGYEGPATIDDCQVGQKVELKGGYFNKSIFLDKSNLGLGAQVREACILEEEAGGAHCVGLKQTILFPFVTLGSLINFCDCLMSGGTSRKNHSEVGSSYIHFNFTPDGDKTTPSLIGDVPRGVMLNQPPIFLGGQGGMVGPRRIGYGSVVAAGSVLRKDYPEDNQLIMEKPPSGGTKQLVTAAYPNLIRIVENNILYLANLAALEDWYIHVRKSFLEGQEFGVLMYAGLMEKLSMAKKERIKRLQAMAERALVPEISPTKEDLTIARNEFRERVDEIGMAFRARPAEDVTVERLRVEFLVDFDKARQNGAGGYVETIQALPEKVSLNGTKWLSAIVAFYCSKVSAAMPALQLFR